MTSLGNICVTGGAGYIGSHACYALAREGRVPLVVDNLSTGNRSAIRWGPLAELDLRDTAQLTDALVAHEISTVMHFAASAYVGESVSDPMKYYDNNVGGMLSLLRACEGAGVQRFVLSSSCATYGIPDAIPVRESAAQRPINPYGESKLICERMLRDVAQQAGMSFAILRYFNVAGADASGALAEDHDPETHLVPLTLFTAAGRRDLLTLFGADYDTPDGTCIRDYIHVSDLVQGHLQALGYLEARKGNLTVNLGSGRGVSNLEIVQTVERITQCHVRTRMAERRAGDPPVLVADTSFARQTLGFDPQRSDIDMIVTDAARSFGMLEVKDAESA
ncbi:UDP-glucose 4-epimerase GalE [Tritonibacter scottomollicae]|uniref:UDP-glucose 4-epimerase n=1 Tax=Tritonibacter scottomollicae TaxID=483013 RepID=A0A2T1A9I8_TRISK|nr:UDP-glucose 4-epimerase GalE [Tritonibacter scottomollicae]PRZ45275.1 UDP-arabinose 4-epimerase [Tritonibacter scottomollicae]